jgi:hypothetical protein
MTEENEVNKEGKLLKAWCIRDEVDYKFVKTLKGKFFPLLEEAHKRQGSAFDRMFLEQKKGTAIRLDNSARLLNILHKKLDQNKFTAEEIKALSLHLEFLPLVEGFFATQINFLIFTLIANGHNFYSTRKRNSIIFLDEIEREDLACRIRFLKKNGFSELAKNENRIRKLRNSAAHVFYEIDSSGDVRIGNEKVSPKAYDKYYDYMRNIAFAVHNIRNLFYFKHFASLSPTEIERIKNVKLEKVKCICGNVNLLPNDRRVLGQQFKCTKCNRPIS